MEQVVEEGTNGWCVREDLEMEISQHQLSNTTLRTASALLSHLFLLLSLALEEAAFKVCFKSCRFVWRIRSSSPRSRMYVNIIFSDSNITLINNPYLSRPSFGNWPRNLLILLLVLPSNG